MEKDPAFLAGGLFVFLFSGPRLFPAVVSGTVATV